MSAKHAMLLALALLCGTVGPAAARPGPGGQPWNDYEVLVKRNIFSRVRAPQLSRPEEPVTREAPPRERFIFLRGIVRREGEFIAVLEDMNSGRTMRVRPGDTVLDGRVSQVTLDGIAYVADDENKMTVSIGGNLEEGSAPAAPATGPPSETTGGSPDEPAEDQAADILERLRQRRLRELGQ